MDWTLFGWEHERVTMGGNCWCWSIDVRVRWHEWGWERRELKQAKRARFFGFLGCLEQWLFGSIAISDDTRRTNNFQPPSLSTHPSHNCELSAMDSDGEVWVQSLGGGPGVVKYELRRTTVLRKYYCRRFKSNHNQIIILSTTTNWKLDTTIQFRTTQVVRPYTWRSGK